MRTRIILADDHPIVREGIRSLLEKQPDIDVVGEAKNGQMAVQLAHELSPDMVVMDINMPGMNGITATRQIMTEVPDVKILALSMHADKQFVMEILRAGAAGYLLKDCAFEELIQAIKAVLSGGKYLSPEIASLVIAESLDNWTEQGMPELSVLSSRETAVARLIAEGKNTREIAIALSVSTKTIGSHRRNIFKRLKVNSTAELTMWAIREGLAPLEP